MSKPYLDACTCNDDSGNFCGVVHVFDGMNTFNYQLVHVSQHVPTIHKLDRLRYKNYFTFST